MIIVHISDTHITAPAAARIEGLRRCVAAINRLRPRADAVVHTGDLAQNGAPAEYALVREIVAPLAAPLYVVPGNRDRRRALRTAFAPDGYLPAARGFLHYTVEHHPVRVVALDSRVAGHGHGGLCAERQAWLEAALAAAPQRPTVVVLHHPPFDGAHGPLAGFLRTDEAAAAGAILARHPQVRCVLAGHAHLAAEVRLGGVPVRTMPSIAVDLRQDGGPTGTDTAPMIAVHGLDPETGVIAPSHLLGV